MRKEAVVVHLLNPTLETPFVEVPVIAMPAVIGAANTRVLAGKASQPEGLARGRPDVLAQKPCRADNRRVATDPAMAMLVLPVFV